MQRREALKLLLAGGVLPALPTDVFAFFQGAHPASGYSLRTLNPHQNDTVVAMIDQIIPETDTPGAKGARVNEFIDAGALGTGCVRFRNDLINHGNDRVILMTIECAQRVAGCRVRALEKSKDIRGQGGQNAASQKQF